KGKSMTQQERRGWLIVASLFIVLLLVFGSGYNTVAVFLPALLKAFPHWSRAEVALLPSVLALSAGISVLPIGWLLDGIEARIVMVFGAVAAGLAFLIASRANSLLPMMGAYLLVGVGISAATVLPGSLVLANWFNARRGLAMGIAISGTTVGGMVMTLAASSLILTRGWRAAYVALGTPMIVVVVPLLLLTIRSRPPGEVKLSIAESAQQLEGFETLEALRTRSFWMLTIANLCFGFAAAGAVVHMVAYLEGIGYKASSAALAMSVFFGCAAAGKVAMGYVADRISARRALAADFAATALVFVMVFGAARLFVLAVFIVLVGVVAAGPLVLLPLLVAESLGRRRYGALGALTGLAGTIGATVGPLIAGRIFDLTGSYADAFQLFILLDIIGAIAAFACQPYGSRSSRVSIAPIPASA
ncbi:MAG TPA: MFS transporter, partial [Candidatus Binataceae bacterium]|nr:MFS transporter [Candidatus Binataceae bacterium]